MTAPTCSVSVVIPAFNRLTPLRYTLRSAAAALAALPAPGEILLVDDGSEPPLERALADFPVAATLRHLRQPNQGSIVARLTGLHAARGEFVQFLDSDDLLHPRKLAEQLAAQRRTPADVSYTDMATAELGDAFAVRGFSPAATMPATDDPAELFIKVQPAPHSPLYRRDYLLRALAAPLVSPDRRMDASGDVWLYYNLATHPTRIAKVPGPFAAPGPHEETRYSGHWEKLGVASLLVMEAFFRACPVTDATRAARTAAGEMAFRTWRGLPRAFHAGFARRMLALWQQAPRGPLERLGAPGFARLARVLGPVNVARLVRAYRARPYAGARTLDDAAYARLFATLE